MVNVSLNKVLNHSNPSLVQCVHLLYAVAAVTVSMLLLGAPTQRSKRSWKSCLEKPISSLRGDFLVFGWRIPPSPYW